MTTYSVMCSQCNKEMLFEQPEPMKDPGELPAFCSLECSAAFGRVTLAATGGMIIDLPCGCFAAVYGVEGNGSAHPWMICEAGKGKGWIEHSLEVHRQAIEIAKRRN